MNEPNAHLDDLRLIEDCISGDEKALLALQKEYREDLVSFLVGAGGDLDEATEAVDTLWADGYQRVFLKYEGRSALRTWLKTVTLNRLLNLKREKERRNRRTSSLNANQNQGGAELEESGMLNAAQVSDLALLHLMRGAIEAAFTECSDEDFVLLQLAHRDRLFQEDLARIWGKDRSWVSRSLKRICDEVQRSTLRYLQQADPWIELQWDDFVEMCRWTPPLQE